MERGAGFRLKTLRKLIAGESLTTTLEGTGSATAKVFLDKIIIDVAAGQVSKYINISTPYGFKLIDVHTIHGNATQCTVQVANTTDAITDALALAATDKVIDRALTIDDAYHEFDKADDDLRLIIGTGAFTGRVIINIELT